MRLTTLDVTDFGCVRQARLELGPGLNVLFGPNDLGKSSLAEAIRAALLLPHTSVEHRDFVPWAASGADEKTPEVTLAFQLGPESKSWSVTKTFGAGARATAVLRSSRDGQAFQEEERSKKVDVRLRELLAWGVPAPGAKGAPRGSPASFLTTVLLARQADVAAVLGTSLTDDPDESGRRRLTDALQQLAQDPRFRTVLERTQERVAEAFTSTGQRRRGADSPFRKLQATIEAAEKTLADLDAQARQGEDVQVRIRTLVEARDQALRALEAARAGLAALEAAARARAARDEAERRVGEARTRVLQVEGELAALAEAERRRGALAADSARATDALAAADAAQGAAEATHSAAAAAAQRLEAEQAQARVVRLQALEQQLTEAKHRLEAAERTVKELQATGELLLAAAARERELADVQARASQQDVALRRDAAGLRLDEVHLELKGAQAAHALLAQAETERARRQAALGEAIRGWEEAAAAERSESAAVEAADERVRAARSKAKAQDRAVRLAELDAARAKAEAGLEAAERDLAAAERTAALAERAARAEADQRAAGAVVERCAADLVTREAALATARLAVDEAELLGRWLALRTAKDALAVADAAAARVDETRRQAAALLLRAEAQAPDLALPTPERVRALRGLEADLRAAEARIAVGLRVVVRPRQPLAIELQRDGGPSEQLPRGTDERVLDARAELSLRLGDLADLVIQGGGPQDQARVADLRARWTDEGAAALAAAGVASVDELDARVAAAAAARAQADGLRQQARLLEEQARGQEQVPGAPDARAAARARVDELVRELAGQNIAGEDGDALARRAGSRSGPDARRVAEGVVRDAQAQVEKANVALAAAKATAEARAVAATAARADAAAAATAQGGAQDPRARRDAARGELASIAAARASAEAEGSVALHQAEAEKREAEARRFDAAARRARLQTARDAAQRSLAEVDGQLGPRREAARGAEVEPLQRKAVAARAELQAFPPAPRARAEATTETELEGRRRAHEADRAALATLQGQLEAARARRDEAAARATASGGAASWDQARRDADAAARAARLEVGRLSAERDRAAQPNAPGAASAPAQALRDAAQRLEVARAARVQAALAGDRAHKALGVAEGEVTTRQARAAQQDLPAGRRTLDDAQAALAALAAPALDASPARLAAAKAAVAAADAAAQKVGGDLAREEGALALVGGAVAQDRAAEAREALERARDDERELDLDYQAWQLLQRALELAERTQTTHLGQGLVPTVSARLAELTARRYGAVTISPELVTEGVSVGGGPRPLERLSVGTREQLATILRLTLAEQLGSFLLLDDQLAQSDTGRIGWFQAALRRHAERHQVVVFTCRPEDYLDPEQLRAVRSGTTALADRLRAVDLERVIKRS